MRKWHVFLLILACCLVPAMRGTAQGQTESGGGSGRKVLRRVDPRYPEVAKKMNLGGTVKVVASVGADGNVRKVEPVGGSPLLVEAAQSAISQWKFVPGNDSREVVELHFNP